MRIGLPVNSREALILREAALPTGVPDLIAVEPHRYRPAYSMRRRRLRLPHLQMLHFLNDSGPTTREEIERLLNQRPGETALVLNDLESAGLVSRRRNLIVAESLSKVFVARRIVAVEAKMRAWREALEQATANLWFASHSYILVPALKCLQVICLEARSLGVGVLVFDGKETRTVVRPRKHAIPASYGSWLINEWALQQLK